MRILEVEVSKLYGLFDHVVTMKPNERITIIHGPNGVGKTALFRLLQGIFRANYETLRTIPYAWLKVNFDDGSFVRVERTQNKSDGFDLDFHFRREKAKTQKFQVKVETPNRRHDNTIRHLGNTLGLIEMEQSRDRVASSRDFLRQEAMLDIIREQVYFSETRQKQEPEDLRYLRDTVDVYLIDTQRLLDLVPSRVSGKPNNTKYVEAVQKYSLELAQRLQQELAQYAALSQSLDRSFPQRIIEASRSKKKPKEGLRENFNQLDAKRSRLIEAGLLDQESVVASDMPLDFDLATVDENTRRVLEIYIGDVERKLTIFDSLARRIDLFQSIINQRFLYKRIRINKENGIEFVSSDGSILSATQLSSGEQHEIVLFYELLFDLQANSFILIDEPELSLHVAWQIGFLRDLQQVTELASLDVLIATHSPQIINDRWDLTVELKGPEQ